MIFFLLYEYVARKYMQWDINSNQLHSLKIDKTELYKQPPCMFKRESEQVLSSYLTMEDKDYHILNV